MHCTPIATSFDFAEPIAHTGVKMNYVFNPLASAYFAIVNGWDDFEDNNHAHSYMTGFDPLQRRPGRWPCT